jgi:uncharacterized protein YdaU (DUF1376 family)
MKYFELNLGDYAEATSHLTMLEDAAYFRLLRKCYATERPLPSDIKAVQRLVGARSKQEREAVKTVLEEFFELEEDGWHNRRADAELSKYHHKRDRVADGDGDQCTTSRVSRYRDERKSLVDKLRQIGIKAQWDTPVPRLREMLESAQAKQEGLEKHATPVTAPVTPETEPVTPPVTHLKRSPETPVTPPVTPQPITNNQEPRTKNQEQWSKSSLQVLPARETGNDDEKPADVAAWAEFFEREHGVPVDPTSVHDRKKFWPLATAWLKAGVTFEQMRQAIERAKAQATEPIAYLPAYADRVLMTSTAKPHRQAAYAYNPQIALEEENRRVAREWLAQFERTEAK